MPGWGPLRTKIFQCVPESTVPYIDTMWHSWLELGKPLQQDYTHKTRQNTSPEKAWKISRISSWADWRSSSLCRTMPQKLGEIVDFSNSKVPAEDNKTYKKQGDMGYSKEQIKSQENDPKEMEKYELADKEFKIAIIKVFF